MRSAKRFRAIRDLRPHGSAVVRHLIGIPSGIVKMDFKVYSLFTLLGSG